MTPKSFILIALIFALTATRARAYTPPGIAPAAVIITENGEEENNNYSGSAPLRVRLQANVTNADGWVAHYEWRFYKGTQRQNAYLTRYEKDTEYTFNESGGHIIQLYATFVNGTDTVKYAEEYWATADPIRIAVSESKLEMPNAFSPNGDGVNDVYKAKAGFQSIVEFRAIIFNRWGQKIYEWNDPAGGWDGKYKGSDAKEGTYFVLVNARGADGRVFNIRKDVNLLRGYLE